MLECSFTNKVIVSSSPVAVTQTSVFAPALGKEFLDIQATIEYGFSLICVSDMIRTYRQIQIPNLNGQMTFLRIYSNLSVISRQWWSSRINFLNKSSINSSHDIRKFFFHNKSNVDCGDHISLHQLSFLHWCFTHTSFFCRFFLPYFNFLNRMFGFTIQNNILFLLIFSDIDNR